MSVQEHATQIPFRDETHFQTEVIRLALVCGWRVFHVSDSRREVKRRRGGVSTSFLVGDALAKGWPDLTLAHPRRGLFVIRELKTNHGRVSVDQQQWLDVLVKSGVDAAVWRPRDLPAIERLLAGSTMKAR